MYLLVYLSYMNMSCQVLKLMAKLKESIFVFETHLSRSYALFKFYIIILNFCFDLCIGTPLTFLLLVLFKTIYLQWNLNMLNYFSKQNLCIYTYAERQFLKEEVCQLVECGVAFPSKNPPFISFPIHTALKKNRKFRLVIDMQDMRYLNSFLWCRNSK